MNSLIIPVYKNEASIPALVGALGELNASLGGDLEVVFVVDGSPDHSASLLRDGLPGAPFRSELVELSRNFGSFAAIRLGLAVARGPYYAVMAADLQEPPELALAFFRCLAGEPVDVVCGHRVGRDDPLTSRLASGLFWGSYRRLVQREIPPGGVDVFACNQAVRDALLKFDETNTSLVGQLFWLGFRRKFVPYQRRPRHGGGKSGWSFRRKL
ncbi:MAG: glycosyltransferase family 2 protein, partial [Planctomycetia bacterium]|nr:glycosyltransferase family 2 protein [Planctomycetia bacterium]